MKSIACFLIMLSCALSNSYSQDKINIGVKGGLNIASISNTGGSSASFGGYGASVKYKSKLLPHFGAYSEFKIVDFFSVQPEILFSMKGYGYESSSTAGSISSEYNESAVLSYIDIPVQMRFNLGKGFHILAGPYVGFLVSASAKTKSVDKNGSSTVTTETKDTSKDNLNTVNAGMYIGVGYQMENGLNFGIRWDRGFSNIYDYSGLGYTTTVNHSNSVFQFSVGFNLASF